ncbi:DUF4332 domain-containing protein [Pirellulales bacterium]|nr:DUF4332 domain-containing protein [Pirellulales bacterium]
MRISKLRISPELNESYDAGTGQQVDRLSPRLNVLFGFPATGQSTLSDLIGHLLYGKVASHGSRALPAEGGVHVQSSQGDYVLRRIRDGRPQGRLTIVGENGAQVSSETIQTLLGEQDPRWLATIYASDFKATQRTDEFLLEKLVSCLYGTVHDPARTSRSQDSAYSHSSRRRPLLSDAHRHQIDVLVKRRDEIARQIEQHVAAGRSGSAHLERQLQEVDDALAERRRRRDELDAELSQLDARLTEIDGRIRYASLASAVVRGDSSTTASRQSATAEVDAEIERCRRILAELQQREAVVRQQLAALHPDGAADALASLASQRATLAAMERLVADLDAEISLLARSPERAGGELGEPARSSARESHARMRPTTDLLRQNLYAMCGQITEQQRATGRRQLESESRQLSRSQSDLSEQLESLLSRRAALVHEQRIALQPVPALPQKPIDAFCQCEAHQNFVSDYDQQAAHPLHAATSENELIAERAALLRRRSELVDLAEEAQNLLATADDRWKRLQRSRGRLDGRASLDDLRDELARIDEQIERALSSNSTPAGNARGWRASDILAQLTDGRLVQIRTRPAGDATVVDRVGNVQHLSSISPADYDLAYLAVVLALVAWQSEQGINLPVILDEPFFRQGDRSATIMASLLNEFATHDCQIFVFTDNEAARRRFESLGVEIQMLEPAPLTPPVAPPLEPAQTTSTLAGFRVVRESTEVGAPHLRVQGDWTRLDDVEESYYLNIASPLSSFPVLGPDTGDAFGPIGLRTVGDLLQADAKSIALALGRDDVSTHTVRLWQTHMLLMCFVPGVSLNDAQVLAACGIESPDDLIDAKLDALWDNVQAFLASDIGLRLAERGRRLTRDGLASWQNVARRTRGSWQQAQRQFGERRADSANQSGVRSTENGKKRRSAEQSANSDRGRPRRKRQPLRFLLGRDNNVADAPSIGPKTAERLAAVGIRSVADLLNADAESTAAELDTRHVNADVFAAWQRQARLTCCIPELRGYGAQLLVACGFSEPQQVADAEVEELAGTLRNFARSREGRRILRDGKMPTRDKVAEWIENAGQMRPLEAA